MHTNSLRAYIDIQDSLTARQKVVYNAIKRLGRATNKQIGEYLGVPEHTITGRTGELVKKKLVCEVETDTSDRRSRAIWSLVSDTLF